MKTSLFAIFKVLIIALCLFSLNFNPQQGLSVGQTAYAATYVAPPRQAVVTHMSKLARLNAFELAIRALVGVSVETVSWVMDEKNTSVRWKRPPSSVGDPEGEKHCRRIAKERGFEYGMTERVEFDGKLAYFKCFNPYLNSYGSYSPELEGVLTFNQIADQMIVNAVTGNKDSQNALDIVKRAMAQANAPKPPLKPSVVVTQPKPTPANPPKNETKPDVKPKPPTPPKKEPEKPKQCKPCHPYPAGTIGYIGPETDKAPVPQLYEERQHYHMYKVNQIPKTCECRWNVNNDFNHQYTGPIHYKWIDLNNSGRPPRYPK